ncbi:MAG: tetratricopeptide repeat protein [Spirochaetes bacterium]|nr:tetratricopeptide repeat protein [Spirochaetota bacterium]
MADKKKEINNFSPLKNNKNSLLFQNSNLFYFFIFLLVLTTFIAFFPSLFNGFTNWDDDLYILNNSRIKQLNLKSIFHIFTSTHYGGYEPLTELFFAIEYHFFKLNPFIYHFNNLILHLINTLLVFWFVFLISKKKEVSILAAFLWSVHPLRVESVAWAAERKDVLFSLFFLLSIISYIYYSERKEWKFYLMSIAFYLICLLPKAQGIMLPFVLIAIDYFLNKKFEIKSLIYKIPYFIIFAVFFIIMFTGEVKYNRMTDIANLSLFKNFLYANFGLIFYLLKFIFPLKLSACYPLPNNHQWGAHMQILLYSAPFIVVISAVLIFMTRKSGKKIIFASLFYIINLILVLQLKRTSTAVAADRYTYIPYIGLVFLFSDSFFIYFNKQKDKFLKAILISLTVVIILSLSVLTWQRTKVWKNSYTLWQDAVKKYPNTPLANNNFAASVIEKEGDYELAIKHYKKAIELEPVNYIAYTNLGAIYNNLGQSENAVKILKKGLEIYPDLPVLNYYLGLTYHNINILDSALFYYNIAIKNQKDYIDAYINSAEILISQKKYDEALKYLSQAFTINPNMPAVSIMLGDLYFADGNYEKAETFYNKNFENQPDKNSIRYKLGVLFTEKKEYKRAIDVLNIVLDNDFTNANVHLQLAKIYYQIGDKKNYEKYLNNALKIDPNIKNTFSQ